MKWWKTPQAAIAWTVIRIWLGIQWIEAGIEKITGGFDAGGFCRGQLQKQEASARQFRDGTQHS